MNKPQLFLLLGFLSAALGVAAGAFGAHGLKAILTPDMLAVYETAVRYQMYHAFGLIAVGVLLWIAQRPLLDVAGWCFVAGTVFFSGSLYGLVLLGVRWLGAVTPLGGIAFIFGWLLMAFAVFRKVKE
jgi:uncharacterized membrane protein YgdD (TMEM256/DUF423 family)